MLYQWIAEKPGSTHIQTYRACRARPNHRSLLNSVLPSMTHSAYESLPDEVLVNIFRHLIPKFARPAHERANEEDLVYNSHHTFWYPLDGDDDSDSTGGRRALLTGCLVSKRIKQFAQPVLYTYVTPWSAEYYRGSASGGRDFSGCLRKSLRVGDANKRFRCTRTLVISITPAARDVEELLSAATSLENVQVQLRLSRDPSRLRISTLSKLAHMDTLRRLFVELNYLKEEDRDNATATLLGLQQITDLTIDTPGAPSEVTGTIASNLHDLYLINADPAHVETIFLHLDTQTLQRLSIIFNEGVILGMPYFTPEQFPRLCTLTLDNLLLFDIDALDIEALSALHTLALGCDVSSINFQQSILDKIPPGVSRLSMLTPGWPMLLVASRNADRLAMHVTTIDLPPTTPEIWDQLDSATVARMIGLVIWRLKVAGITVVPDVTTDEYDQMSESELQAITQELLDAVLNPHPEDEDEAAFAADVAHLLAEGDE